jgi:hypothetical protein
MEREQTEARRNQSKQENTMTKQHIKQVTFAVIAVLALSVSAFAQDDRRDRERGRSDAVEAATEAFGFTEEQIDKIREIRRERPPRGQSDEEREAWRTEQQAKVAAVLTDEQRAKIARLNEVREQMRDYAVAARMGLVETPSRGRSAARSKGNRGGNRARSARGRSGPSRGRRSNRGRGADRRPGASRGSERSRRGRRAANAGPQFAQARRAPGSAGPFRQ